MDRRSILVVDDEDGIRELIAEVLICEGYTVASARNGRDALRVMEDTIPALILLDVNMTVLDGFGFVKALVARGIIVPTILVSAANNLAKHAKDLGAAAFVGKPFEIAHLLMTVERHYQIA